MADDLDTKTRSGAAGIPEDDPLAELARIIGYERPGQDHAEPAGEEFDLEAELMAELDVPAPQSEFVETDEPHARMETEAAATAPSDEDFWSELDAEPVFDEDALLAEAVAESGEEAWATSDFGTNGPQSAIDDDDDFADSAVVSEQTLDETPFSAVAESAEPVEQPSNVVMHDFAKRGDDAGFHDDVLAEMSRFSLPDHATGASLSEPEDVDLGYQDETDIEAVEEANDPERFFEASTAAQGQPAERTGFEDFLSTELDVYEQELSMGAQGSADHAEPVAYEAQTDDETEAEPASGEADDSAFEQLIEDLVPTPDMLAEPVADADDGLSADLDAGMAASEGDAADGAGLDSVFDLAAKEFLADSIPQEADPTEGDIWDMPGTLDEALEEAVSEELDLDEAYGQAGFVDPADDAAELSADNDDDADIDDNLFGDPDGEEEMDLDLEQALAETFLDDSPEPDMSETFAVEADQPDAEFDPFDALENEQPLPDVVTLDEREGGETTSAHDDYLDDSDPAPEFLSEFAEPQLPVEPERDEIAEAFLDLIPGDGDATEQGLSAEPGESLDVALDAADGMTGALGEGEDPAASTESTVVMARFAEPQVTRISDLDAVVSEAASDQTDDWLSGFDAANDADMDAAFSQDDSAPDFDADAIGAIGDDPVPVAEIDVPELPAIDAMVPREPDFGDEIDVEFAGLETTEEPVGTGATVLPFVPAGIAAAAAAVTANRSVNTGEPTVRTTLEHEGDPDYTTLESELEAGFGDTFYTREQRDADDLIADSTPVAHVQEAADDRSRPRIIAAAALGVALLVGASVFGYAFFSGDSNETANGEPPIIRADSEPVKVVPESPGGLNVPNQDKAVYDRVAGDSANGDPGQPSLVTQSEEPVDIVQRTLDPELLPLEGRDDAAKSEERLTAGADVGELGTPPAQPAVSPRKVRTMIVRPDGTIVPREEPAEEVAAAEPQAPTGETAAPAVEPAPEAASEPVVAQTEPAPTAAQPETAETPEAAATPVETAAAAPAESIAPVRVVKTQPVRPQAVSNAPVPAQRPAEQPVNVVSTVTQGGNIRNGAAAPAPVAPAQPVAQPAAAAPAPVSNAGGYWVQIASQPSVEGAQASWNNLSRRYASVLGGRGVDIQRADIPGKGTFHRVRVPGGSRDEANALCARYKAAGGSCFVSR